MFKFGKCLGHQNRYKSVLISVNGYNFTNVIRCFIANKTIIIVFDGVSIIY